MLHQADAPGVHELLIERHFEAPAALVWRLWTDAELLKRWFGPKDFTCPSYSLDFRIGGRYRGLISSRAHGDSWFGGQILEIVPNEKLIMSFAWEAGSGLTEPTVITIAFSEAGGVTTQSFHQAPFASADERDSHHGGWSECLDKQVAYLARSRET